MKTEEKRQLQQLFGEVIREIRMENNLSQIELAERGDFNRTYISDLERGIKQASLTTIIRLADALNIKAEKLVHRFEKLRDG
jgi:transcriptional regulator with XRE-family HTH domain